MCIIFTIQKPILGSNITATLYYLVILPVFHTLGPLRIQKYNSCHILEFQSICSQHCKRQELIIFSTGWHFHRKKQRQYSLAYTAVFLSYFARIQQPVYCIIVMFDHGKYAAVPIGFLCYQRRRHKHRTPAQWLPVSGGFAVTHSHRAFTAELVQPMHKQRMKAEGTQQKI